MTPFMLRILWVFLCVFPVAANGYGTEATNFAQSKVVEPVFSQYITSHADRTDCWGTSMGLCEVKGPAPLTVENSLQVSRSSVKESCDPSTTRQFCASPIQFKYPCPSGHCQQPDNHEQRSDYLLEHLSGSETVGINFDSCQVPKHVVPKVTPYRADMEHPCRTSPGSCEVQTHAIQPDEKRLIDCSNTMHAPRTPSAIKQVSVSPIQVMPSTNGAQFEQWCNQAQYASTLQGRSFCSSPTMRSQGGKQVMAKGLPPAISCRRTSILFHHDMHGDRKSSTEVHSDSHGSHPLHRFFPNNFSAYVPRIWETPDDQQGQDAQTCPCHLDGQMPGERRGAHHQCRCPGIWATPGYQNAQESESSRQYAFSIVPATKQLCVSQGQFMQPTIGVPFEQEQHQEQCQDHHDAIRQGIWFHPSPTVRRQGEKQMTARGLPSELSRSLSAILFTALDPANRSPTKAHSVHLGSHPSYQFFPNLSTSNPGIWATPGDQNAQEAQTCSPHIEGPTLRERSGANHPPFCPGIWATPGYQNAQAREGLHQDPHGSIPAIQQCCESPIQFMHLNIGVHFERGKHHEQNTITQQCWSWHLGRSWRSQSSKWLPPAGHKQALALNHTPSRLCNILFGDLMSGTHTGAHQGHLRPGMWATPGHKNAHPTEGLLQHDKGQMPFDSVWAKGQVTGCNVVLVYYPNAPVSYTGDRSCTSRGPEASKDN